MQIFSKHSFTTYFQPITRFFKRPSNTQLLVSAIGLSILSGMYFVYTRLNKRVNLEKNSYIESKVINFFNYFFNKEQIKAKKAQLEAHVKILEILYAEVEGREINELLSTQKAIVKRTRAYLDDPNSVFTNHFLDQLNFSLGQTLDVFFLSYDRSPIESPLEVLAGMNLEGCNSHILKAIEDILSPYISRRFESGDIRLPLFNGYWEQPSLINRLQIEAFQKFKQKSQVYALSLNFVGSSGANTNHFPLLKAALGGLNQLLLFSLDFSRGPSAGHREGLKDILSPDLSFPSLTDFSIDFGDHICDQDLKALSLFIINKQKDLGAKHLKVCISFAHVGLETCKKFMQSLIDQVNSPITITFRRQYTRSCLEAETQELINEMIRSNPHIRVDYLMVM